MGSSTSFFLTAILTFMSTAVNRAQEERHKVYKKLLQQQAYHQATHQRAFEKALLQMPSQSKSMPLKQPIDYETPIKDPIPQRQESTPKQLKQPPSQAHQALPKPQVGIQQHRHIKLKSTITQGPYLPNHARVDKYVPILFDQAQKREGQSSQHEQEPSEDAFGAQAAKLARLEQTYVQCAKLLAQSEISELVESMHVGINQQGLCLFTLELKSPELFGVCVEVSCVNRLVDLKLTHTNTRQATLIKNNIQILRDKLADKKLGLAKWVIV